MGTYTFRAELFPNRPPLTIPGPIGFQVETPYDSGDSSVDQGALTISAGKASVEVETLESAVDLPTLRIRVEEVLATVVNVKGYLSGRAYNLDIVEAVDPSGQVFSFVSGAQGLEDSENERPLDWRTVLALCQTVPSLPRVFANLRNSILFVHDTGLFCFRAMEVIREPFDNLAGGNRDRGWDAMRNALRVDRSWLRYLQDFAEPQRHGSRKGMTGQERILAIRHGWQVVDRYCLFLHRDSGDLPEREFELLIHNT